MFGEIGYCAHEPYRHTNSQKYKNGLSLWIFPENKDDKQEKKRGPSSKAGNRNPELVVLFYPQIVEIDKRFPIPIQDPFKQSLLSFDSSGNIIDIFLDVVDLLFDISTDILADIVLYVINIIFDVIDKARVNTLLIGTFCDFALDILGSVLKLAHTLAQAPGDIGNLIGTKDHHHDKHDEEYLAPADKKKMHCEHATNIMKFTNAYEKKTGKVWL